MAPVVVFLEIVTVVPGDVLAREEVAFAATGVRWERAGHVYGRIQKNGEPGTPRILLRVTRNDRAQISARAVACDRDALGINAELFRVSEHEARARDGIVRGAWEAM